MPLAKRYVRLSWLVGVLALGAALAAYVPGWVEGLVRERIASLPGGYRGSVERVELRVFSAELALVNLRIEKNVDPPIPAPYLRARELRLSVRPEGRRARTHLHFVGPVVNLVDGPSEARDQWGPNFSLEELREQLPFELSSLRISDARVHLRVLHVSPRVDLYLSGGELDWSDLSHCLPPGGARCRSDLKLRARVMGHAPLLVRGRFARSPESTTELRGELRGLSAESLSPLLIHYAEVDLQGGRLDLAAELALRGERYTAWLVPYLHDLQVRGGDRKRTRWGREFGLSLVAGWLERKDGEKAVRLRGTRGKDDLRYDIVAAPPRFALRGGDSTPERLD